jgi:hypothetical protein
MDLIIIEQDVELVYFNDFVKEIEQQHYNYCLKEVKNSNDLERLNEALKAMDLKECAAIAKSWHLGLEVHSGVFRHSTRFLKNTDGSYRLKRSNDVQFNFSPGQVLLITKDPINIVPIPVCVVNSFISRKPDTKGI